MNYVYTGNKRHYRQVEKLIAAGIVLIVGGLLLLLYRFPTAPPLPPMTVIVVYGAPCPTDYIDPEYVGHNRVVCKLDVERVMR
jgi:hypothetical protein